LAAENGEVSMLSATTISNRLEDADADHGSLGLVRKNANIGIDSFIVSC
jgi:hypothetical protein